MPQISINFHATTSEMVEWISDWLRIDDVYAVALRFQPFSSSVFTAETAPDVFNDLQVERVCLTNRRPDISAQYHGDFETNNPDALVLEIGRLTDEGLRASWLATRTDNQNALLKWKKVQKHLKGNTTAGVTVTSRSNGVSGLNRSHRYSVGAKTLQDGEISMIPIQGSKGPIIHLGKIQD